MKTNTFSSIAWKHTVTDFLVGLFSFLVFDYSTKYADPVVSTFLRQTDHPMVTAGPLFQVLRGLLFGIVFYVLRDSYFSKPRGWTAIWLVLILVGILSPFSAAPGSIEGFVYSTLPTWFHMMSLPELFIQSFLLACMTHYWVNHPEKKWLSISFGIVFAIVTLLALLGILSGVGILPAPT